MGFLPFRQSAGGARGMLQTANSKMLSRTCAVGVLESCMCIPKLVQLCSVSCSLQHIHSSSYGHAPQKQHLHRLAARSTSAGSYSSDEEGVSADDDQLANTDTVSDPSAIVRLQVVKDVPRHDMPLLLGSVRTITRSGFAVTYQGQDYLLTAASAVVHATQIRVYVGGRDKPFKARVAAIAAEADLAVLSIVGDTSSSSSSSSSSTCSIPSRTGAGAGSAARGAPRRRRGQGVKGAAASGATVAKAKSGASSSHQQGSEEEEEFWSLIAPLELAANPPDPQDRVTVQTLPAGQPAPKSMSGQVLTLGLQVYPGAMMRLLGLQVACGSSREAVGAPVVDAQGACLGAVFQRVKARTSITGRGRRKGRMESMVHAAPVPVIEHVLHDIHTTGKYQGFPQLGIRFARLESPALRQYLGMQAHHEGILLTEVGAASPCAGVLQPGDVILAVGGKPLSNDGTVEFRPPERVSLTYHVAQLYVGQPLEVKVLRQGQEQTLTMPLATPPRLLQLPYTAGLPSFLLLGGLVLTPVTVPYLELSYGRDWPHKAPASLRDLLSQWPKEQGEQPVVIAAVVQEGKAVEGYKPRLLEGRRVLSFRVGPGAGGPAHIGPPMQRVTSLRQLAAAILACSEGEVRLELHGGPVVVLSLDASLQEANQLVMKLYQLQHPVSADLVDLLPLEQSDSKGKDRLHRKELAAVG